MRTGAGEGGEGDEGLPLVDGEVVPLGVARRAVREVLPAVEPGVREERVMVELGVLRERLPCRDDDEDERAHEVDRRGKGEAALARIRASGSR